MPTPSTLPARTSGSWLTAPVWTESPADRAYRRGRLFFTGPFGGLLGLTAGILAAQRWELVPLMPAAVGAVGGFLTMYVTGHVESLMGTLAAKRGPIASLVARVGVTVAGGALFGRVIGGILGADGMASLTTGASIFLALDALTSRFFWGGWVEAAVDLFSGQLSRPPPPAYSYADSLLARGEVEAGLEAYEDLCAERPGDPEPPLHAAWAMHEIGRWDEALVWFRRALRARRIDARRAAVAVRQVWEIEVSRRKNLAGSVGDLAMAVDRFPDAPELEWARRELEDLRRELARPSSESP